MITLIIAPRYKQERRPLHIFQPTLTLQQKRKKKKEKNGIKLQLACNCIPLIVVCSCLSKSKQVLPTWRPIQNLKDPEVLRIANFAVTEHNKEAKTNLTFVAVLKGETIVVAGLRYKLVISAKDGDSARNYPAEVWSKPWLKFQQLISFGKLLTN